MSILPPALLLLVPNRAHAGQLAVAESLVAEAVTIGEATGSRFFAQYCALVIEPWRGREAATRQAIEAITRDLALQGEGKVLTATHWASAVLCNGLARYEEAYVAAERGCENPQELGLAISSMVELVEAATRSGRPARAAAAALHIDEMAQAAGTDWALGTSALVRAQVSGGPAADALYREAIERLGRTEVGVAGARSRLLHGEWLRRRTAAPRPGSSWAPRTSCSGRWGPRRSLTAPGVSCRPPARRCASAPSRCAPRSPPRRRRSRS
ncbi:hypothetical protein ACFQ0B_37120 [Nonomuraea thailandensis]